MQDIFKISEITGVSLRTLRKVEKHGFLKAAKSSEPMVDAIRANLKKGNRLTAIQQLQLLKNPKWRDTLAQWSYEIDAALSALGDALENGAPWPIAVKLDLAARKDAAAIGEVARWMRWLIDSSDDFNSGRKHDHAYIAVRLLANVPEHQLETISKALVGAMWQCRNHESLTGCWHVNDKSRTFYHRPNKKAGGFDL